MTNLNWKVNEELFTAPSYDRDETRDDDPDPTVRQRVDAIIHSESFSSMLSCLRRALCLLADAIDEIKAGEPMPSPKEREREPAMTAPERKQLPNDCWIERHYVGSTRVCYYTVGGHSAISGLDITYAIGAAVWALAEQVEALTAERDDAERRCAVSEQELR